MTNIRKSLVKFVETICMFCIKLTRVSINTIGKIHLSIKEISIFAEYFCTEFDIIKLICYLYNDSCNADGDKFPPKFIRFPYKTYNCFRNLVTLTIISFLDFF
jgi:hypothetical protein